MAHEGANDEPHVSEYTGKGSSSDSDDDEGLNVESNANVTKLLTTQESSDSNETTNANVETISAKDTLKHMLHTLFVRKEEGSLTKDERDQLEAFVERGLDILDYTPEDAVESAPQEVQETCRANGSSSARPLVVEDENRQISMPSAISFAAFPQPN